MVLFGSGILSGFCGSVQEAALELDLEEQARLEDREEYSGSGNYGQRQVTSQCQLEDERSEERVGNIGHGCPQSCD
jgi:hypothetical protein